MADGDGSNVFEAPPMNLIVEAAPSDTLLNCALIVRFMARRLNDAGDGGFPYDDDDADAVYRILGTVADALVFEHFRAGESKADSSNAEAAA